ncbi:MAG: DUF4386 domain-containing protein [Dehalococcoidia bacterium]
MNASIAMKSATRTNQRTQVDSTRKISLVAGIFFLLTFVHVGILFLYEDVLNDTAFILGAGSDTPVRIGAILDLLTGFFGIATGVILFQVLRRQNLAVALGYAAVRTFEAMMIAVGTLCLLAIVTLRDSGATGADAANLTSIGSALVAVRDWTFVFGPGLCAGLGNGLLLGYLMFRSGLVPRKMALLGVIGGPLSLIGLTFVLFGQWEQDAPQQFLFTMGEIAWELSLSLWLIIKGFNRSPITEAMNAEAN